MEPSDDPRSEVRNYLRFLQRAGFLYLVPAESGESVSSNSRLKQLEALRVQTMKCEKCKLSRGRTHVVFGEGNPDADLMFVGEAPGRDEDLQGRPFIGRAGQLLDKMIVEAGMRREDVFIANIIKCRPPDNRDPEPEEIAQCEPYLLEQIDHIRPRVIVALGRFAAHALTRTDTPITRMRGQLYLYHDVKLMPTLHPAAILRNMNYYADALGDIKRAAALIRE
jgi:uracil-DNA glycosylase family 4